MDNIGQEYGVRVANVNDAKDIIKIYTEIYGDSYFEPGIYDPNILKANISNSNEFWFVGVSLSEEEIVGSGVVKKIDELSLEACKAVITKKFQKRGIGIVLGTKGILSALSLPRFNDTIRLVAEARAFNLYSQKVLEKTGAFAYGFNPVYMNLGKRDLKKNNERNPYIQGSIEPTIYYIRPLSSFWKKRDNEIYLLDNESIIYFYQHIKKTQTRMKKDEVIIESRNRMAWQDCDLLARPELGAVFMKGYLHNILLQHYLYKYSNWRFIEWRVPATEKGIDSMNLALNNGFKVIGYDIGSLHTIDDRIVDCVIFAKFLHEINFNDLSQLKVTPQGEILVNKVIFYLNASK